MDKKKKIKFNAVDALVLVLALVVIVGIAVRAIGARLSAGSEPGGEEGPKEYYVITFTSDSVADDLLKLLRLDAPVTDDTMTHELGTLVDFQTGPSVFYELDESGKLVNVPRPDYQSLKLMCRVEAEDNGFGVTVDHLALGVGHTMIVRADQARINMVVYDIQKLSDTAYPAPAQDSES